MSISDTEVNFMAKNRARDYLDSLEIGEAMTNYLLEKVAEVQYSKMIEEKKKPYVVLHTTLQSLTCVEMLEMKPDYRRDDYLLSDMHKE